jgi:hypothetical protein
VTDTRGATRERSRDQGRGAEPRTRERRPRHSCRHHSRPGGVLAFGLDAVIVGIRIVVNPDKRSVTS